MDYGPRTPPQSDQGPAGQAPELPPADIPVARMDNNAFRETLSAINVGLETFHDSLAAQGADVIHVEWRPPAGGNEQLMSLLELMRS